MEFIAVTISMNSTSVNRVKPDKTIRNKAAKPRTHSMSFQKGLLISTF